MNQDINSVTLVSEELLTKMLAEVMGLNVAEISPEVNFSEYGVDSLYGIQLIREVEDVIGREIDLRWMFDYPTIRQFCAHLQTLAIDPAASLPANA